MVLTSRSSSRYELVLIFHTDLANVSQEALWPPQLLNYIHRWMHRQSLYNLCASKTVSFSELIDALMFRANLPVAEPITKMLAVKCRSLIRESALKWKSEKLLIQKGSGFSKQKELKAAWAAHEDWFEQAETAILGSISLRERAKDDTTVSLAADVGGLKKVIFLSPIFVIC
jgi:hypothetical protein